MTNKPRVPNEHLIDPSTQSGVSTAGITDEFISALADQLGVSEVSIIRRVAGLPVRGRAGRRIDRALAERNVLGATLSSSESLPSRAA